VRKLPDTQVRECERWRTVREGIFFAILAGAYLQYHLLDVMLQIESMRSVVVFV
jgi:hypothetical protein